MFVGLFEEELDMVGVGINLYHLKVAEVDWKLLGRALWEWEWLKRKMDLRSLNEKSQNAHT
jgi:hypothetical protein